MMPAAPAPRAVPGPLSLLRDAAREAWAHRREPLALAGALVGSLVVAVMLCLLGAVAAGVALGTASGTEFEPLLLLVPVSLVSAVLAASSVMLTANIGAVRAISQRMDGGPPIQLRQCVRLTWPRLLPILGVSLLWTPCVFLGLAAGLLPGCVLLALGNLVLMGMIVHGLRLSDALVLGVTLFTEHPRWHLAAGALWSIAMAGPLLLKGILAWTGTTSDSLDMLASVASQLSTLTVVVYTHFWLLSYKALVGHGRTPIWPSRA